MKKYIKLILTICLTVCTILCIGLAVGCKKDNNKTFTVTVLYEDGKPVVGQALQCCDVNNDHCNIEVTNEKGQYSFDKTESVWKNSPTVHILFFDLEGYSVYKGDEKLENDEDYVNHHKLNGVTYTLKMAEVQADPVIAGCVNNVTIAAGETKTYSTVIPKDATGTAIFEANVAGGEFDLVATAAGSNTPITATLNTANPNVTLNLGTPGATGLTVIFTLTSKNTESKDITFNLCPVYELGGWVLTTGADLYKVYFNIPTDGAELTFEDPLDDGFYNVEGYPITLTIGTAQAAIWNTVADIQNITTTLSGCVAFTFSFGGEAPNLSMYVKNANAPTDEGDVIVLGQNIEIVLPNSYDGKEYTFTCDAEEATTYVISIEGGSDKVWVSYSYVGDKNVPHFEGPLTPNEGIIEIEMMPGVKYTFTFGTDNESGDSYTVVLNTKGRN